jgi:hypothetical protein
MSNILSAACAHAASSVRALAVAVAAIGGLAAGEAAAGDLARAEVIGFSVDGRYVAYEDYGVEGEGSPYSTIYVIDVAANAWVPGSPIHFELFDEDPSSWADIDDDPVALTRDLAMEQAQPMLDRFGIVAGAAGTTLVHYPLSDVNAPTHEVQFSIHAVFTTYVQGLYTLYLSEQEIPHAVCDADDLGPVSMMALELQSPYDDAPVALQIDQTLPESRLCVSGYRIHSVIVYAPNVDNQVDCCASGKLAMLVLLETAGWGPDRLEGTDYRHLGVTGMVPYAL